MKKLLILLMMVVGSNYAAGIKYIDVTSTGVGNTMQEAINVAISESIAQIHGKSIESNSILVQSEVAVSDGQTEEYYESSAYAKAVKTKTKGVVSSYQIISKSQDEDGLWNVEVTSKVAKYDKGKRGNRKRIALIPVKFEHSSYDLNGRNISSTEISNKLTALISTYLVQTRKFAVLDRQNGADIKQELDIASSDQSSVEETARLGNTLVADYGLVVTIGELNYITQQRTTRITGRKYTVGNGVADVNYRLIDVATQEIIYADGTRVAINHDDVLSSSGTKVSYNALTVLSDKLAKVISNNILQQVFPIAVIKVTGNNLILGQGGKGIKIGERYKLYHVGDKLFDPYTKESLGREEREVATIEITRVLPKQSYAKIVKSDEDVNALFKPKRLVLREKIIVKKASALSKIKKKRAKKKAKKDDDDDW